MPTQEPVGIKRVPPCSHAGDNSAGEPTWVSEINDYWMDDPSQPLIKTLRGREHAAADIHDSRFSLSPHVPKLE